MWFDGLIKKLAVQKVPDINNVDLKITQHSLFEQSYNITDFNFMNIDIKDQVMNALKKMAAVVDEQIKNDTELYSNVKKL